jgi:tripartite-type tricarboxylate transporter receptor subunit TctC
MGKVGRRAFAGLIAAVGLCAALGAQAQAWPSKPVKFVVGAAAGGSASDAATRFFADRIREATGQAMLVENKPGADGNVAAEIVVRSPADGYTALVTGNNTHAANIHLYKALNYDPYKDFAPVTTYARVPYILLANPDKIPARTLKDFIAFAKANPGKLNYASAAVASRVGVEQLKVYAGFYIADAVNALVQIRAGRAVGLGVTVNQRLAGAPELPTIAEQGFPDYDFSSWLAVWVPAATPPEAVRAMSDHINKAMDSDAGKDFLAKRGLLSYPGSPQALLALQTRETERWGRAIKAAGMEQQ